MHLDDLVECNDSIVMISNRHHQALSVAFVEKILNIIPSSKEFQELFKSCKLDVGVEVLALLENTDRQCFLDERPILFETWHHLESLSESFTTLLTNSEGR